MTPDEQWCPECDSRDYRAEVERLKAELETERLESASWRATARDKGESARALKVENERVKAQREALAKWACDDSCAWCGYRLGDPREWAHCSVCEDVKAIIKEVSGE